MPGSPGKAPLQDVSHPPSEVGVGEELVRIGLYLPPSGDHVREVHLEYLRSECLDPVLECELSFNYGFADR